MVLYYLRPVAQKEARHKSVGILLRSRDTCRRQWEPDASPPTNPTYHLSPSVKDCYNKVIFGSTYHHWSVHNQHLTSSMFTTNQIPAIFLAATADNVSPMASYSADQLSTTSDPSMLPSSYSFSDNARVVLKTYSCVDLRITKVSAVTCFVLTVFM